MLDVGSTYLKHSLGLLTHQHSNTRVDVDQNKETDEVCGFVFISVARELAVLRWSRSVVLSYWRSGVSLFCVLVLLSSCSIAVLFSRRIVPVDPLLGGLVCAERT